MTREEAVLKLAAVLLEVREGAEWASPPGSDSRSIEARITHLRCATNSASRYVNEQWLEFAETLLDEIAPEQ